MCFSYRVFPPAIFSLLAGMALAEISEPPDALFLDTGILDVRIVAPWTTLVRERPKEDYLPGMFQYSQTDGKAVNFDIEIRTRGHFRHSTCDFPPIRLNFKKSQTEGTLFDNQNKMKLVVHCDDSKRYEQIVLREYLAYRIFNVVTNMSFRARLLRVTYVDSEERRDDQVRFAFLIEHKNRLAERYDMKDVTVKTASVSSIQADRLNLTSVFAFLIGNTDFSPLAGAPGNDCCHNYVLFRKETEALIPIPYDFDQSGFVDAPYATPNENLRIRNVRQRLYRGRCANNEYIPASLQRFRDSRDAIYTLVNEQEGFEPRVRKSLVRYIDKFYKLIEDPRDVERKITRRCI